MEPPQNNDAPDLVSGPFEAFNRAILDTALDGIITMDATGRVREFNPAAERIFGFTRAEAVGKELAELIVPPELRAQHRRGLAHYLKTGEGPVLGHRIEITGLRSDGSRILVELAITPFKINGAPFFTAYLRDITERKRNEETSRHLASIVESSEDAVIGENLTGIIMSWNAAAERLFGYKAEEVLGKPVSVLIPPDRRDELPNILENIRQGGRVRHYDTIRLRKNGSVLNISLTVSPIKDGRGHVIGASKIGRDITQRVRSDRRRTAQYAIASLLAGSWTLAEASAAILQTIASIGDWALSAIWLYDEKAGVLRCKSVWHSGAENLEQFTEFSRSTTFQKGEGLPGRVWDAGKPDWISDVTVDPNFPRAVPAVHARLRAGFAFPLFAGRVVNGIIEMFSQNEVAPDEDLLQLVDALGTQIGMFIERRRIEQELQQEKESAEAANAAKDRFLAMLSHELRTPLTPILIWAGETAKEADLGPEIREGLRMVCRNVELEARLIDDMLDLTRITRGKLKLQLGPANIHELVQHALEIVQGEVQDRHVEVSVAFEAARRGVVVDAPRLQQVFWNIFRNAFKFTPENAVVSVRSHNPAGNIVCIEISDSGIGIEPQFLGKIFEAFEQLDKNREGLGLGLSISKAIIEMHGGTICARSDGLGKGATFVIELPTATSAQ